MQTSHKLNPTANTTTNDYEILKSGYVKIINDLDNGKETKRRVFMGVYRNENKHIVKLYVESNMAYILGYMRMGNNKAELTQHSKRIRITTKVEVGAGDDKEVSNGLLFEAKNEEDAKDWIHYLLPCNETIDCESADVHVVSPIRTATGVGSLRLA